MLLDLAGIFVFQFFEVGFGLGLKWSLVGHLVELVLLLHVLGDIEDLLLLHIIKHPDLHFLSLLLVFSIYYHLILH